MKQRREKLNKRFKPFSATFLALAMVFVVLFSAQIASAVWYNPFTWGSGEVLEKNGGWYLDHMDGIQLEYFNYEINDLGNGKAKICLNPKTPLEINNDIIQQSKATIRKNNIETRQVQPSDMEIETEQGKVKKMCIDVDILNEDYIKFGENSAQFEYTSESIIAYDDTSFFNDNYIEIGKLSLSSDFEYKNGKPNINLGVGNELLTHTFYIENYTDTAITNVRTINMKNLEEVDRNINLKWLSYNEELIPTYEIVCDFNITTQNETCSQVENGTRTIWIEQWNDMSSAIEGQNYILGVFADTKEGDYIDIDFDYYGISVLESPIDWATWDASLSSGLIAGYKMEDTSGTVTDVLGVSNFTNNGATLGATGKIDLGVDFDGSSDYLSGINVSSLASIDTGDAGTISLWFNADTQPTSSNSEFIFEHFQATDRFYFGLYNVDDLIVGMGDKVGVISQTIAVDTWYHVVITWSGTNYHVYLNTSDVKTDSYTPSTWGSQTINIGRASSTSNRYFDGTLDEMYFWDRVLTTQEISDLYNGGVGITYPEIIDNSPVVTLTAPTNNSNLTSSSYTFQATITDDINLVSACLLIDNVCVDNDTSPTNGSNSFTGSYSLGIHNWSVIAFDNSSQNTTSDVWYFNYTQPPIVITNYGPADNLITNDNSQDFIAHISSPATLVNVTFVMPGYANITNTSGVNNTNYTFSRTLTENTWTWYIKACDTTGDCEQTPTRTIEIDDTRPTVTITAPVDGAFFLENQTLNLNWTVTDANLEECWYNYNGANTSLTCGDNTTTFNLVSGQTTIIFYANDTATNLRTSVYVFNVTAIEGDWYYPTSILEGSTGEWQLNITTDGTTPNEVYLVYDGSPILGSINEYGTNQYTLSASKTAPGVSSSTNYTAYFSMTMSDLQILNSTSKIQTVNNFGIDNCDSYNETLFNFTLYNEKNLAMLNGTGDNTLGNINLQLYSRDDGSLVLTFEEQYNQTNPFRVCLENNITASDSYNINLELEYTADSYAREYYYISNEILNDDDLNTKIPLYLLDNDSAQSYKITYKDANFLPVSGVLQLQRKYIDEGVYRTVEQPKMDSNGQVILQVELEDAVYTINVLVNGEVDATFSDIRFYCPNPLIENCEDELNSFESGVDIPDYESINGVTFSLSYNDSTRTISVPFVVTTGTSKNMGLNVWLYDAFGNTSVCTDTLVSSGGTLSCVVPSSFGNATVIAELTDAGSTIAQTTVRLDSFGQDQYGFSIVVIGIVAVMLLIMIGLTPGEPLLYGVFLIIGTVLLGALNIIFSTSWVGAGATLLWFMIAVIVIIIKGGDR